MTLFQLSSSILLLCLIPLTPTKSLSVPKNNDNKNIITSISPLSSSYAPHLKTKIASSEAKGERRRKERASVSREICSNCNRPPILCVCDALPQQKIETKTHVLVLQHPNEFKRKSLSTVPLMPLVLQNCIVKVGYNFQTDSVDAVRESLERGQKPLLLFPGPDAITLDGDDDNEGGGNKNHHELIQSIKTSPGELLILIDGTWAEARRMLMQSPELVNACQEVQFSLECESIYDVVRKEPEKHCISTLEACAESLSILEQDDDIALNARNALHGAMRHMVDIKRKIYEMRNPEPRFTRPGMQVAKRMERAKEVEEEMFGRMNE
jgi:DTW domain-containing protein YfiP